ncbi:MAG: hypothetical protein PHE56_05375 [Bacteroidales bacterium]|nr:hypothetical protein [Bacteroidales bacterium]
MGKSENIKRAKKLKEAKRKRESDAQIAQGLGPAGKAIQQKSKEMGVETRLNTSGVKYSDLLKEFIDPILHKNDSISMIKLKVGFGALVWNATIMGEKDEKHILSAKEEVLKLSPNDRDLEQLFDEMVRRKQEEFYQFKNIIVKYELRKIRGLDYDLTVAHTPTVE